MPLELGLDLVFEAFLTQLSAPITPGTGVGEKKELRENTLLFLFPFSLFWGGGGTWISYLFDLLDLLVLLDISSKPWPFPSSILDSFRGTVNYTPPITPPPIYPPYTLSSLWRSSFPMDGPPCPLSGLLFVLKEVPLFVLSSFHCFFHSSSLPRTVSNQLHHLSSMLSVPSKVSLQSSCTSFLRSLFYFLFIPKPFPNLMA